MVCHPAGLHIWEWFLELCGTRGRVIVMAGLAGVITQPGPISHQEMAAWASVTGRNPTPWEARLLRDMDGFFLMAAGDKKGRGGKEDQDLGEYCRGRYIEKCRAQFGAALETVCSTCPS